jgi:hypothetical protein
MAGPWLSPKLVTRHRRVSPKVQSDTQRGATAQARHSMRAESDAAADAVAGVDAGLAAPAGGRGAQFHRQHLAGQRRDRHRQPGPVATHRAGGQQPAADGELDGAADRHPQTLGRGGAPGQCAGQQRSRGGHARRRGGAAGGVHHGRHQHQRKEDRRHHRRDRRHCLPDQHPGAECGGGGGTRRRAGARLCRGGQRGAQPSAALGRRGARDQRPRFRHPGAARRRLAHPTPPPARARAHPPESTSFVFESSEHAASLFNMERSGHVYSRISNPTNAVLEERIAALEGGSGAIAVASGQAALHLAIATLAGAGSHIVASSARCTAAATTCCTTRWRASASTPLRQAGRHRRLARRHPPDHEAAVRRDAGQPGLDVLDIPTVSAIAHEAGLPLLVDSTFTTPWLMKPFEHGADLVYHSATKFLCGHGTVVGGVLVDSGRFDWDKSGRFPELTSPTPASTAWCSARRAPSAPSCCARGARAARLRRLHEPAHRLADPAGHRDAAAAHGAACGQHAQGGGLPGQRTRWWRAWATRSSTATRATRWQGSCCRAAAARCSAST